MTTVLYFTLIRGKNF